MMSANNSRVFQYYLDNFFKFPKEIKNDIVYCQRSLKAHIKVHQMVIDVVQQQEDADPAQKQRILDEIESEIYEINGEQHFLLLRLRRIIDEFYKMLKRNDVPVDYGSINALISLEVIPLINDPHIEILPKTVLFRNTEQRLIEKYFEVQKEKAVYEIDDSDEEENLVIFADQLKATKSVYTESSPADDICLLSGSGGTNTHISNSLSQMSLLKPISQRILGNIGIVSTGGASFPDASKFLQMNLVEGKIRADDHGNSGSLLEKQSTDTSFKHDYINETPIELPVSKNVKMSRLNLRQALNKARTENMVAKAAANLLARAVPLPTVSITQTNAAVEPVVVLPPVRKYEIRTITTRNNASNLVVTKERGSSEINSSSDDSNPERFPTPYQPNLGFMELEEERTLPEHYGQEMFLRIFQLFTPIVLVQMQQRRSKRKRRTVHNNERADFHYGRIEYGYPPPEKKRKAFLLSPQVKRVLQSKRPKRGSAEKNEEIVASRSSSSSPDEKRSCNECLKSGGCFDQCSECKGYYHQSCHRDTIKKAVVLSNKQQKLCPACRRSHSNLLKKEAQQNQNLHSTAQELEKKLAHEKDRRASLQQESKMYKLQMRNLFNIVKTIKSDQENDSSE